MPELMDCPGCRFDRKSRCECHDCESCGQELTPVDINEGGTRNQYEAHECLYEADTFGRIMTKEELLRYIATGSVTDLWLKDTVLANIALVEALKKALRHLVDGFNHSEASPIYLAEANRVQDDCLELDALRDAVEQAEKALSLSPYQAAKAEEPANVQQ